MEIIKINKKSIYKEKTDLFRYSVFKNTIGNIKFLNGIRFLLLILVVYAILWGLYAPENKFTTGLFWGLFWPFFIITSLVLFGNIFCMICPHGFLVRFFTKIGLKKNLPKFLKKSYIGFGLLIILYWFPLYSMPGVWKSSLNTALLFLFFTIFAIVVSYIYNNSVYCKYFCPIGRILSAFNRVGPLWLSSYSKSCESCKKPVCVFSCSYNLNPSKFDKNNSMETCTLCMDCSKSCDAIKYSFKSWSNSLFKFIKKPQQWEIWIYILFLAVISFAMKYHHGLGHSQIKDYLPWVILGKNLNSIFNTGKSFDFIGLLALIFAVFTVLVLTLGSFYILHKITNITFNNVFLTLGYSLAPLMLIGSLSHIFHFFFIHYYYNIINGFSEALFLDLKVSPLLTHKNSHSIKLFSFIFSFLAVFWSGYILWKRIDLLNLNINLKKKIILFSITSLTISFYFFLTLLQFLFTIQK